MAPAARMEKADLDNYRQVLEELAGELRKSLQQLDTTPVSPDNAIGRLTRLDAMQSQQLAHEMVRRETIRLQEVENALRRIERGEYGICTKCGEDISAPRLRVRPEARLCVGCASR
jgi:DnaK suppressor protein